MVCVVAHRRIACTLGAVLDGHGQKSNPALMPILADRAPSWNVAARWGPEGPGGPVPPFCSRRSAPRSAFTGIPQPGAQAYKAKATLMIVIRFCYYIPAALQPPPPPPPPPRREPQRIGGRGTGPQPEAHRRLARHWQGTAGAEMGRPPGFAYFPNRARLAAATRGSAILRSIVGANGARRPAADGSRQTRVQSARSSHKQGRRGTG